MRTLFFIISIFILMIATPMQAQQLTKGEKIKYTAEKLTNTRMGGKKYKKLIGNVVFTQGTTTVYCDSSYFYTKENKMEGFGHVIIKDDSVTIMAQKLIYEGKNGMAYLRQNVVYQKGSKFLYTDFLNYSMITEVGNFSQKGKLVDDKNTLTSTDGVYYAKTGQSFFYHDVLLVSQDFNLKADTLEYSTITKVAITKGPTFIENKEGTTVDADGGTFRTVSDHTILEEGTIETRNYIITGDKIFINDQRKIYTAKGNVIMTAKKDKVLIFGDEVVYNKNRGISKVYGEPIMKRVMQVDTLYMSADTLVTIENVDKDKELILAYWDILVYKKNLQGKSDSAVYFVSDSTIQMYSDPVLWNKSSQMMADTIDLVLTDNTIKTMILQKNAFLISKDTLGQHNQIKGRLMTGNFDANGNIESMDINGNGESHYYLLKGDSLMLGMNKIFCSAMRLVFEKNVMRNITFYTQPEAKFIPPHELTKDEALLDGFDWKSDERPTLQDVVGYSLAPKRDKIQMRELHNKIEQDSKDVLEKNNKAKKLKLEQHLKDLMH